MIFKRRHTPQSFWEWFFGEDLGWLAGDTVVRKVGEQLRKYHSGLVCEVAADTARPRDLVISADGIADHITAVETLVDAAPETDDWNFIRFRPRSENYEEVELVFGDVTLTARDLRFVATPESPYIHLDIFSPHRTEQEGDQPDGPTFIMLDIALGEYDVMCRVGRIAAHPIDAAPPDARPFIEVRQPFDSE